MEILLVKPGYIKRGEATITFSEQAKAFFLKFDDEGGDGAGAICIDESQEGAVKHALLNLRTIRIECDADNNLTRIGA